MKSLIKSNKTLSIGLLLVIISFGPLILVGLLGLLGVLGSDDGLPVLAGIWVMLTGLPSMLILLVGLIVSINDFLKSRISEVNMILRIGIILLIISKGPSVFYNLTRPIESISSIAWYFTFLDFLFYPSLFLVAIGIIIHVTKRKSTSP